MCRHALVSLPDLNLPVQFSLSQDYPVQSIRDPEQKLLATATYISRDKYMWPPHPTPSGRFHLSTTVVALELKFTKDKVPMTYNYYN